MFTLDTESGFRDVVLVTAAYGLGENVVGGAVNPDEFLVYKPALEQGYSPILQRRLGDKKLKMIYAADTVTGPATRNVEVHPDAQQQFAISDEEVLQLARMAIAIEKHYTQKAGQARPMDIEWARDGTDGDLYIVQARPETVYAASKVLQQKTWQLGSGGSVITRGRSIGRKIGSGPARIILEATQMHELQAGEVLVTDITDPDWEPIMKKAAAIVTNRGGRVCHAAIIARELGIPAVVGTNDATRLIRDGQTVTVSCAEGDEGFVYEGELPFEVIQQDIEPPAKTQTKILLNIGNPGHAFEWSSLPADGVGLARLEFIITNTIGIHPSAMLDPDAQTPEIRQAISDTSSGYANPREFYIERMAEGIGTIAAAFHPKPVHVRLSDFKSSEYAALPGGSTYEPREENPMLGLRGASRYYSQQFRRCFELECEAIRRVRETMGLKNIRLIIPFVRSVEELDHVLQIMGENGLQRGVDGLQILVMCELPANVIRAEAFLQRCDGFSIGSNDLAQLTLGIDRESSLLSGFDERDAAVMEMMRMAITACKRQGKYVSICGQAPSDFPDMAAWLVQQGIDAISVNHDSLISVMQGVIATETCLHNTA
jgi:pyruvate,water dikinase